MLLASLLETGGTNDPLFGFNEFVGWLTELREIFHVLDYQFIIKGNNSETAGWKSCVGKIHERVQNFHALLSKRDTSPTSPHAH